ncbi:MAG: histidine phosphatase family protein [Firmicutes bacterium]|nr:histidine phosphatase family protein [Bacillota bacterium]
MIYYVRHGETVYNKEGKWSGLIDTGLTTLGVKQALELGQKMRDVKIDLVFVSPQIRARQTAEIALSSRAHENRPPVITDSRIVEWYSGEYEGFAWHPEFDRDFYGKRELYNYKTVETFGSVEARIKNFFDELRAKHNGKNILVIAHGGIAKVVHAYFHGKQKSGLYCDAPDMKNCDLIEFAFGG